MTARPVPENYPRLSPYLAVDGATEAMRFYCDVLGFAPRGDVMTMPTHVRRSFVEMLETQLEHERKEMERKK